MIQTKEVLRLKLHEGRSHREVARAVGVSVGVVAKVYGCAQRLGLSWEAARGMSEKELATKLYGAREAPGKQHPEPVWEEVRAELQRKGVTLGLLHAEYLERHPEGMSRRTFCRRYAQHCTVVTPRMRQHHTAGEKMFVDYAGPGVMIMRDGVPTKAEVFVAVLGASNLSYVEVTWTQRQDEFIGSCMRAMEFFGGAPRAIVPDNLKSAVTRPDRYEPQIARGFAEFAEHYGTVVLPARPYKPRDKAKVEVCVQIVERWILARLRNEVFTDIHRLNARVRELLAYVNEVAVMRRFKLTRRELFERVEKAALSPLPAQRYDIAVWKRAKVHFDYHLQVDEHYYSVPHTLIGQYVNVRMSERAVEVFTEDEGERVASHVRSGRAGSHTTVTLHMPEAHRQHSHWTPERIIAWAESSVGPETARLCRTMIETRRHPQQGYRAALGVIQAAKRFDKQRVEAACRKALEVRSLSSHFVVNVLKHGLENTTEVLLQSPVVPAEAHENVRGPDYYH